MGKQHCQLERLEMRGDTAFFRFQLRVGGWNDSVWVYLFTFLSDKKAAEYWWSFSIQSYRLQNLPARFAS